MPRNVMKMCGEKSEEDTAETARRRFYRCVGSGSWRLAGSVAVLTFRDRGHRSDSFYPEDLNELREWLRCNLAFERLI